MENAELLLLKYQVDKVEFAFNENFDFSNEQNELQDWKIINKYNKINSIEEKQKQRVEMKFYDERLRPAFFRCLDEFLHKTLATSTALRWNTVEQVICAIDKLIEYIQK